MISIHCSKKLYDYLGKPITIDTENDHPVIGHWHGELVTIGRSKHLLFCHDSSRTILILADIKKANLKHLPYSFKDVLINSLLKTKIDIKLIEELAESLQNQTIRFDTATNRSIQSTIRLRLFDFEAMIETGQIAIGDIPQYSVSIRLSDSPNSTKIDGKQRHFWPYQVLSFEMKQVFDAQSCWKNLTMDCIPSSIHSKQRFIDFAKILTGGFSTENNALSEALEQGNQVKTQYQKNWELPQERQALIAAIISEYHLFLSDKNSSMADFKSNYSVKLLECLRLAIKFED